MQSRNPNLATTIGIHHAYDVHGRPAGLGDNPELPQVEEVRWAHKPESEKMIPEAFTEESR
jgi:hypothetical protein